MFRIGDKVRVLAGSAKGKEGQITAINGDYISILDVKPITKHIKPSQNEPEGRIAKLDGKIHRSNIVFLDGSTPSKIIYKEEKGKRVRVAKKTGKVID